MNPLNLLDLSDVSTSAIPYKSFLFKTGENHFQLLGDVKNKEINILVRYNQDSSIIKLMLAVDALRRGGANKINLFIPFFPGARQDRICNPGEALTVRVYANLINSLNLDSVTVFDPHSDVTPALLNNVRVVNNYKFVADCMYHILLSNKLEDSGYPVDRMIFISPDAGANKKIFGLSKHFNGTPVVRADKIRDTKNGNILDTEVYCDDMTGKIALIVDDIISGGRTFLELAKKLKEKNFEKIYLIVSHHEGHANTRTLQEAGIDLIYSTDSVADIATEANNKQFKITTYL